MLKYFKFVSKATTTPSMMALDENHDPIFYEQSIDNKASTASFNSI